MTTRRRIGREIFVFTPEEKRAAACVLAAIVLGLTTMHYRATHPPPLRPLNAKEERAARRTAKTTAARARSARGQASATARSNPPPLAIRSEED